MKYKSLTNWIKDISRGYRAEDKQVSVEHASRIVMEKKNLSDFERQLHDMKKHMSPDGVSINPNYEKLEKDQSQTDSTAADKEKDKSVVDIPAAVAKADSITNTPEDEQDKSVTDTPPEGERKLFSNLEKAQRVLKIRNLRAQNKIKIIDNP